MTAPAPERTPRAATGALVLSYLALRSSMIESAVRAVLRLLGLLRAGEMDEAEAWARLTVVVSETRTRSRDLQQAYLQAVFAQHDGDAFAAPVSALPEPELDEVWEEIVTKVAADSPATPDLFTSRPVIAPPRPGAPPAPPVEFVPPSQDVLDRQMQDIMAEIDRLLEEAAAEAEAEALDEAGATIIGFRRVIHPELAEGGTCGACVLAATRMYLRGNLKPMHDGCNCTVLPVTGKYDPADDLNTGDGLWDAYAEMNTTDAWAAKQFRFKAKADGSGMEMVQERKKSGPAKSKSHRPERNSASEGLADLTAAELGDLWLRMGGHHGMPSGKRWRGKRLRAIFREFERRKLTPPKGRS